MSPPSIPSANWWAEKDARCDMGGEVLELPSYVLVYFPANARIDHLCLDCWQLLVESTRTVLLSDWT